jgi:two-component system, NarL family, sensor histidine kinase UhpB
VGVLRENLDNERRALRAERELSDSRELARWIDHHLEQERRLIARELHDELGQSVTAMRSMALSIAQRLQDRDAQAEQAARLIADESSRLYDAMHGLIPRLAPPVLDALGLEEALADLAERTRRSHAAVRIELKVALAVALQPDAAIAIYRAAQEGITNALRHGQATRVQVNLASGADGVALDVIDDGSGLPEGAPGDLPVREGHYGLRWLAERVGSLGGQARLVPAVPAGAHLIVRLPPSSTLTPNPNPNPNPNPKP